MITSSTTALVREHDLWLRRLAEKYHMPRALLARHLCAKGALEYEIATLIADAATRRAYELFQDSQDAPTGTDLFDRAVRGVYQRLVAARNAQEEAERQAKYRETDDLLRRMKAGES